MSTPTFYVERDGRFIRIRGNPNMSDEQLEAVVRVFETAYDKVARAEQFNSPGGKQMNNLICEVPSCKQRRASGRLMCHDHWYQVPKKLQNQVWQTWKRVNAQAGSGRNLERRITAIEKYREARRAAIESVL